MNNAVEQIKERLNILDVVGSYVQLQKAGRQYKGKSPFTNEKTPSFFVSPERGMYYCFSSGKGGDIFRFIEEMEGVDFKGALKMLAERAHIELTPQNPQKRTEREALYALIDAATAYFEDALRKHEQIRAYLTKRGVNAGSIAKWRIGYAQGGWRNLKDHLAGKGFGDAILLRSGLIKRATEGNSLYDVFRDRVMFPICDSAGRVVAFSGRAMASDPALPKYVNSPETELFEKSRILFGYHIAKQSIRTSNFSLIVEGQFDLVLAHQAGFKNAVAISGTALSLHHTELLERLSSRVVLALDADRAGVSSVQRAAHIMLARGMDVKVALLAEGKDPADLVAEDPALLKAAVRTAVTVVEFLIAILQKATRDERAFRLRVRDEVLPLIVRIPNRIDREHFEQVVSTALGTTREAVHYEVERSAAEVDRPSAEIERSFGSMGQRDEDVKGNRDRISTTGNVGTGTLRTDELARFVYGLILWQEEKQHAFGHKQNSSQEKEDDVIFDTVEMKGALKEAVGEDAWRTLTELADEDKSKLMFEVELHVSALPPATLLAQFHGLLRELSGRTLKQALHEARAKLREAESSGDEQAKDMYLAECAVLQKRLSVLGGA